MYKLYIDRKFEFDKLPTTNEAARNTDMLKGHSKVHSEVNASRQARQKKGYGKTPSLPLCTIFNCTEKNIVLNFS